MGNWFKAGAVALALSGAPACADILTFDDLARPGTSFRYLQGTEYNTGGYRFVSLVNSPPSFIVFDAGSTSNADPGGATFAHRWSGTEGMKVSREDGALFDLVSLDYADLFNTGAQFVNDLYFEFGDGTKEQLTIWADASPGLQSLVLDRKGLKSWTIAARSVNWMQLDNIKMSLSAVPEPASWMMMLGGMFIVGRATRSRIAARRTIA